MKLLTHQEHLAGPVPTDVLELSNDTDPRTLDLDNVARIDLHFPKFTDGRAYSQAFLLRRRLGFQGELRATGGVLQDQIPFMLRCGFDSFESEQNGFGEALAIACRHRPTMILLIRKVARVLNRCHGVA